MVLRSSFTQPSFALLHPSSTVYVLRDGRRGGPRLWLERRRHDRRRGVQDLQQQPAVRPVRQREHLVVLKH